MSSWPIYKRIPESTKTRLNQKIAEFMDQIRFEGCGGLEVTEEMTVLISAQACLLVVNMHGRPYRKLRSVLIYPSAFKSTQVRPNASGIHVEEEIVRLGESWDSGTVILAWDSAVAGVKNIHDGRNVSMHEFAHQLDQADGSTDGVPALKMTRLEILTWCQVMQLKFEKLIQKTEKNKRTVIDSYGATNPAEFFAVATETFFEKPKQLKSKWPKVFDLMEQYYKIDPSDW